MLLASSLHSIPLFSQLRESDLVTILQAAVSRSYAKNSIIAFEDDPEDALYVVVSGKVKVVLTGEDGREVILSIRREGDFFGEMSLIADVPRLAHVIAMEDSNLLMLRREHFHRCIADIPQMAIGLLRAMCERMRQADHKIGGLVLLDVPGRVSRVLLEVADQNDGVHITKEITHNTIAQMIGSTRETVSRAIRDLAVKQLITVSGRTIAIRDRDVLEHAAGLKVSERRRAAGERRKKTQEIEFPNRRSGADRRNGQERRQSAWSA